MDLRSTFRLGRLAQCCALIAMSVGILAAESTLAVYTNARSVHGETNEEALRHHPVRMRGVVTFFDASLDPRHPALFVHDATGAVFINATHFVGHIAPGTILDIVGISDVGDFAPVISHATVTAAGQGALPPDGPLVSVNRMISGEYDGAWVVVEGVIRSVIYNGPNVQLRMSTEDGPITATTSKEPGADYDRLVDTTVRIRANCAPVFNRHLQLTGARLVFPDIAAVEVMQPAPADPFLLPLKPIDALMHYTPNLSFRHRTHVRGAVTLQWPGRSLCVQDAGHSICVQTAQTTPVHNGEVIDIVGFPALGAFAPTLSDATYRSLKTGRMITARTVTAEEALRGEAESALVTIEGKLIGRDHGSDSTFMLSSGSLLFPLVLPERRREGAMAGQGDWPDGSIVRVTGICSVSQNWAEDMGAGFSVPTSFRILLRSPADVVVLERPSWWTPSHLLPLLVLLLALTLCIALWAAILRHRLAQQTKLLSKQNGELTQFSFQDGLTGLANRRKFDETLASELERAAQTRAPLSLLMIDIDHFKALNDSCGHQQGDACLVQVARALVATAMRGSDLMARYGGEEFAVILPLSDEDGAWAAGERIRRAVLELEIPHPASPSGRYISVSVGTATVVPEAGAEACALIAMADSALYHSKQSGRNRITCASSRLPQLSAQV